MAALMFAALADNVSGLNAEPHETGLRSPGTECGTNPRISPTARTKPATTAEAPRVLMTRSVDSATDLG